MTTDVHVTTTWSDACLVRADRRAVGHLLLASVVLAAALVIGWTWLIVLSVPVVLELASPGLRHFFQRKGTRQLIETFPWRQITVAFVAGRRIGRQTYLHVDGSENYLRLSEMPERARVLVRHSRRVWIAGPDARGRVAVLTRGHPFVTRGRVVDKH